MNGSEVKMEECKEVMVYMWGYLPGTSPEKSPILSPTPVRLSDRIGGGNSWKDICGGGCGFAMAISGSGKLTTWGSVEDEGQSYLTSGKHGASVVKAVAGWAHCVSVIEKGEAYTWGWRECIPSAKVICDLTKIGCFQKDLGKYSSIPAEQGSPRSQGSSLTGGAVSNIDSKRPGEEAVKRRKMASSKHEPESSISGDEFFTVSPCLVTFSSGVRITTVAAGGRHTLALSGVGLGLWRRRSTWLGFTAVSQDGNIVSAQASKVSGSFVKEIACGGRHSAIITDAGALLTFGWGLYGQCGQGGTYDQLRPTCVNSLSGVQVEKIAAGLWHTLCVSADGCVYAFGGNQFGQLGTGADQAEALPRLLDSPCLEGKNAKMVSCGARHSTIVTEDVWSWQFSGPDYPFSGFDQGRAKECRMRLVAYSTAG
ncbi:hypothetical protein TIFTF001_029206 [Ficus carica]|uniref:Ultraviolet-B receptor UVR8 n=1 Tax=Ficus carica TaxID=3494 RepID=A0AA88DVD3_FICCA|nr:hypothetical protein TIFTF001_029206 [Ficus carica]